MIETRRMVTAESCGVTNSIQAPVCSTTEARFLQYLIQCIGRNTQPKKVAIDLLPFDFGPTTAVEAIQKNYFTDSFLVITGSNLGVIGVSLSDGTLTDTLVVGWSREIKQLYANRDKVLALRRFRANMMATVTNTTGMDFFIEAIDEHLKETKLLVQLMGCVTPDGHRAGKFFATQKALEILLTKLDLVSPE